MLIRLDTEELIIIDFNVHKNILDPFSIVLFWGSKSDKDITKHLIC